MNIEVHQPRLQALIQERMASGHFQNIEDALVQALEAAPLPKERPQSRRTGADLVAAMQAMPHKDEVSLGGESSLPEQSLAELFEPIRGLLTDEEVDTLFRRDPSPGRVIDLS